MKNNSIGNANSRSDVTNSNGSTRRQFLHTQIAGTVAVAGLAMTPRLSAQEKSKNNRAPVASDQMLRIGLVGCGGRGVGAVIDSLTINPYVQIVAAADLEMEKCRQAREGLAMQFQDKIALPDENLYAGLDAYKRILDHKDVDIVYFATPPGFRPQHLTEAVEAGKHIFAEKPTCVDPIGFRACLQAHNKALEQGTAIVTGTQYRRQTNYIEAVKQIREGAIGEIVSATTRYCTSGTWYRPRTEGMTDLEYQLKNWMHFIWLSGDQIAEQAVHNIDAMNWVMDSVPVSAFATGGRFTRPEDSEMWDCMSVDFEYPGNRIVSFKCRQWPGSKSDNGNVIYGTKGIMHIGAMSTGSHMSDYDGNKNWSAEGSIGDAYQQEHKALVDSIRAGKPIVELKETAESSLTAVMGRMAAYTGQLVTWDFVAEESKLDLFPPNLTADSEAPQHGHAVPGHTKLV